MLSTRSIRRKTWKSLCKSECASVCWKSKKVNRNDVDKKKEGILYKYISGEPSKQFRPNSFPLICVRKSFEPAYIQNNRVLFSDFFFIYSFYIFFFPCHSVSVLSFYFCNGGMNIISVIRSIWQPLRSHWEKLIDKEKRGKYLKQKYRI